MQMMRFDGKQHNEAFSFKYPKAGDPNSKVQLFVVDLATGERERIDTGLDSDQYLPRIGFTPDGRLWYHRINRRQNTFEVQLCEPNGAQRTIYEERAQQYVERVDDRTVTFIDKERFLVRQESHTGFMHLYLYGIRGGFLAQVTKRSVGGDRGGRRNAQTGVVPLDRDFAPAPQPLQRGAQRQGQASPNLRTTGIIPSLRAQG